MPTFMPMMPMGKGGGAMPLFQPMMAMPMGKGGCGGKGAGDWQCPNRDCVNHNRMVFGKNDSCPQCGSLKGARNQGDWKCPNEDCMNHHKLVFAKHDSCPKCGSVNPVGARERSRSPPNGY
jgi:hypothetical protein